MSVSVTQFHTAIVLHGELRIYVPPGEFQREEHGAVCDIAVGFHPSVCVVRTLTGAPTRQFAIAREFFDLLTDPAKPVKVLIHHLHPEYGYVQLQSELRPKAYFDARG